jgi:carbon storage regulator
MLVLSRKQTQSIIINGTTRITVLSIRGNQVRIGIEAPDSIAILREDLCESVPTNNGNRRPEAAGAVHQPVTPGSINGVRRESIRCER